MSTGMDDASDVVKQGMHLQLHADLIRQSNALDQIIGPTRKSHQVRVPHAPEYLAERAAFLEKWRALQEEGLAKGFLIEADYEGIFADELDHRYETVYDETEEEFRERTAPLAPVTFRTMMIEHTEQHRRAMGAAEPKR